MTYTINPFDCTHPTTALRFRRRRNGIVCCVEQCLVCGCEVRAVGGNAPERLALTERVPFDEEFPERVQEAHRTAQRQRWAQEQAERNAAWEQAQAERDAAWWNWYNDYLKSPAWRDRRTRVLERDGHICQACLRREATQVHHLTYARVGNEPLFDLTSICTTCHQALHADDNRQ